MKIALLGPVGADSPGQDDVAYANPHLLVTTEWLADQLDADDTNLVVVDVRGEDDYLAGHVPGAVSLPLTATYDPEQPGYALGAEALAPLLGARGIDAASLVVLYDEGRSVAAPRVLWILELVGHAKVAVLDGGLTKWTAEEFPTSTDAAEPEPRTYEAHPRPERCSTVDDLLADLTDPTVALLDARSSGEFASGRIPGAVRIEWHQNFTTDDVPVFLGPEALRALYADQGVIGKKRVHAY